MNRGCLRGNGDNFADQTATVDLADPLNFLTGDLLSTGESTVRRRDAWSTISLTSQQIRLVYFTARKTEIVTNVRTITAGTAAGATPTICRVGIWWVAPNGTLVLYGATANDTTLWASTHTVYTEPLASQFTKVAGQRYAVGCLCVTSATAPLLVASGTILDSGTTATATESAQAPVLTQVNSSSQSDLATSFTLANNSSPAPYVVLL